MSVGADFYSAAELEALALPGLPKHRQGISRVATQKRWAFREREGRGGGREFPLAALPAIARAEILHRRIAEQASKATGTTGKTRAPAATLAALSHRQAERHSARTIVLEAFDLVKGDRSARATLDLFVAAFNAGEIEVPAWVRRDVKKLSVRTVNRWLAARGAGWDEALAGRWTGGRRSVFALSPQAADFLIGAHCTQPLLGAEELHELLVTEFPQGLPDENGVLLDAPSIVTVNRFIRAWHADAANAQQFLAFTNPDASKSHHRFAAGKANQAILVPNQRWEIDASPADVLCSDGRQSIYVLVDIATRRLMAIVTATPRTAASLLLIARACQAWGVPEILGTDNGSDFTSKHFRIALRQLGVHHKMAPPYSPERKPFVERAIGSVQKKFMPLMPGFVGASVAERTAIRARAAFASRLGVSDAEAFDTVAITAAELQEKLAAWLVNVYAHRPHSGLGGRTPHDVAAELLDRHQVRFAEERALGMLLMPPAGNGGVRVVGKKAIRVDGVDYWTDRLIPGQRLQVRLDPADAGKVWLYTDTDPWRFVGIGLNPELAGLDRAELAARIRAEQAAIEKEGRARLRKLVKQADIHSVADRLIGTARPPIAANMPSTWSTPELDEALKAADFPNADNVIALRDRSEPIEEETADERYARAKRFRDLIEQGHSLAADALRWLDGYEASPEFRGLKLVEDMAG